MRITYLIHHPVEMPGAILQWALDKQHQTSSIFLCMNEKLPDLHSFDSLVIMGGPMNIYEEEKFPWLKTEKEFIKKAIIAGKNVLGICLGAQLVADVLGSKVYRNAVAEIGWFAVALTKEGANSELLSGLDFSGPVLHWHGDTFNIPDGAVHLMKSEACNSQAFMYGDNVLALQFHFETTVELLTRMIKIEPDSLIKARWVMNEEELLEGEKYMHTNNQLLFNLLDRFFG
jgi:GMP synthase-like glutamine amidotransferase